jgi:hypothetical protein
MRRLATTALLLPVASALIVVASPHPAASAPAARHVAVHETPIVTATGQVPSDVGAAEAFGDQLDLWNFVVAANYAQSLIDAEAAARATAARPRYTNTGPAVSGPCGESGGDPNAVNPSSGAFGCWQELPSHFAPGGSCAGLDMHTVDGQRECANRLPLSAWGS